MPGSVATMETAGMASRCGSRDRRMPLESTKVHSLRSMARCESLAVDWTVSPLVERGRGRHVEIALHAHDDAVVERVDGPAKCATSPPATSVGHDERPGHPGCRSWRLTDKITPTIPSKPDFRGVPTLVLSGVGSRLDLPFERMDDLQLAVLSMLEASSGEDASVEIEARDDRLAVSVGPLRAERRRTKGSTSSCAA